MTSPNGRGKPTQQRHQSHHVGAMRRVGAVRMEAPPAAAEMSGEEAAAAIEPHGTAANHVRSLFHVPSMTLASLVLPEGRPVAMAAAHHAGFPGVLVKQEDPFFSPPSSPGEIYLDNFSPASLEDFDASTPPFTPALSSSATASPIAPHSSAEEFLATMTDSSPPASPWSSSDEPSPLTVPPLDVAAPSITAVLPLLPSFTPRHLLRLAGPSGNCTEQLYLEAIVKVVEAVGEAAVTMLDRTGFAFVHHAVVEGFLSVLHYLKNAGFAACFHLLDYFGNNSLLTAVIHGRTEVIPFLIEVGVNPRHRNNSGHNALRLALDRPREVLSALCFEVPNLDINERDSQGKSVLHYACAAGLHNAVQVLLSYGADPALKDHFGTSPLLAAIMLDHSSFLELLCEDKTVLDSQDRLGRTPMHWAAAVGNLAAMKLLVAMGAKLEGRDKKGRTPFLLAAFAGHTSVATFLRQKKANTEVEDYQGVTYK